jgi:hypothetical protein
MGRSHWARAPLLEGQVSMWGDCFDGQVLGVCKELLVREPKGRRGAKMSRVYLVGASNFFGAGS